METDSHGDPITPLHPPFYDLDWSSLSALRPSALEQGLSFTTVGVPILRVRYLFFLLHRKIPEAQGTTWLKVLTSVDDFVLR